MKDMNDFLYTEKLLFLLDIAGKIYLNITYGKIRYFAILTLRMAA